MTAAPVDGDLCIVRAAGRREALMTARGPYEHTGVYTPANVARVKPPAPVEKTCGSCLGRVNADGETLSECGWVQSATCDDCGACFCDGSC